MRWLVLALAAGSLACIANGPTPRELAALMKAGAVIVDGAVPRAEDIRSLRCEAFEEEPTEYACDFKVRNKGWAAIVAIDGPRWVLLEAGPR